jgi:hypothetical protein
MLFKEWGGKGFSQAAFDVFFTDKAAGVPFGATGANASGSLGGAGTCAGLKVLS